ncbi:MAG: hypothetical protein H7255_08980 [Ramlibacter sp.]|nr:hypothetical protein [Ramlibacter sp.]
MNLSNLIPRFFRKDKPSSGGGVLRNKPGGIASVVGLTSEDERCINGCVVKTVSLDADGLWIIDPPLPWTTSGPTRDASGAIVGAWCPVLTIAMPDRNLEPWPDIPDADLIDAAEPTPKPEFLRLPVREMSE